MKDFTKIWKTLAASRKLTATNFVELAILKAVKSKRNVSKEDIVHALLQKYFEPITQEIKLSNGRREYDTVTRILTKLKYSKTILGVAFTEIFESAEEEKLFFDLASAIRTEKLGRQYVYYFTMQEGLTPEQQGVQAGHALFCLGTKIAKDRQSKIVPERVYFQWVGVKNEDELMSITKKHKHNHVAFRESDLDNKVTSIAFYPVLWNKRDEFKDYSLLTH